MTNKTAASLLLFRTKMNACFVALLLVAAVTLRFPTVACTKATRLRARSVTEEEKPKSSNTNNLNNNNNKRKLEENLSLPEYSARDKIARFLEQATFGPSRQSIDEVGGATNTDFEEWILQQMDTTQVPMTSHREFYRTYATARSEFPFEGGIPTHPCQKGTKYRLYAFSNKDQDRSMMIETVVGSIYKRLKVGNFVRTLVTDASVNMNPPQLTPSLVSLPSNIPYKFCIINDAYLNDDGDENSYIGVVSFDGQCRSLWLNGKQGNAALNFDLNAASPNNWFKLDTEASAPFVQPHMTANYGGLGRTPPVQEIVLTADIHEPICQWLGPTGNPEYPVFAVYQNKFWIHDPRFQFQNNTVESPLIDGGATQVDLTSNIAATDPDAVSVKCANAPRTFVNEAHCIRSSSSNTCSESSGILCGSPGEIANDLMLGGEAGAEGGAFDVNTVKHLTRTLQYRTGSRKDVWMTVALKAKDQLRQRIAWALAQILVISPTGLGDALLQSEAYVTYYDIFVRHAFGNYRDVLKEVSYSPMMGEMLTYVDGASTASVYLDSGNDKKVQFPDENYAREIMQLFTIGLAMLHPNGIEIRQEQDNKPLLTYTNAHIEEYAKVWTGFTRQWARGNMERHYYHNRIDPMTIDPTKRDMFPKMGLLHQYIGDGYPLCVDLPEKHFLKAGAKYRIVDSSGQPELQIDSDQWAKSGAIQRMRADPSGQLYESLCQSSTSAGDCEYPTMVELTQNLVCSGDECLVDTIRTIQIETGVFYEYIRPPCVEHAFYAGAKKIVPYDYNTGPNGLESGSGFIMCANPKLEAANSACCSSTKCSTCGIDDAYDAFATDQMFWGERMRYTTAEDRCAVDGLCPLPYMGTFCGDLFQYRQGCTPVWFNANFEKDRQTHFWTTDSCQIKAKVDLQDGKVGIVHSTNHDDSLVAAHVQESTKTHFIVDWDSASPVDIAGAVSSSSSCVDSSDGRKICDVTVIEEAVFSHEIPPISVSDVLSKLSTGAFYPSVNSPTGSSVQSSTINGVKVYHINDIFSIDSVFEVTDQNGVTHLRKNVKSTVSVDGTALSFRNPVHMVSLVDPEPRDLHYETDAAIDHYFYHPNTAPFLAIRFSQRFGISNPSPEYVENIAAAFRTGSYISQDTSTSFGSGKYGDMSALVAAVLLEPEARNTALDTQASHGSLGEPLIRLIKLMRALEFQAAPHHRITGALVSLQSSIGQMAHEAPSVFSYFLPEFSPAGTRVSLADRVSPESQLLTSPNVINLMNIMYSLTRFGLDTCYYGLASWSFGAVDTNCLGMYNWGNMTYAPSLGLTSGDIVDELASVMTAGRLSNENRAIAKAVYDNSDSSVVNRLVLTQQVIATSSEFHAMGSSNIKSSESRPTPSPLSSSSPPVSEASYKAVVYVMLAGGYDSWNLLVPHTCHNPGTSVDTQYQNERGILALTEAERTNIINIDDAKETQTYGSEGAEPCSQYAIHPNITILRTLFDEGELSFFANVGVYSQPVMKGNYNELTQTKLFAHNTMQAEAKRVDPYENAPDTGVLGRALDILAKTNIPGTYSKYGVNSLSIDTPALALRGVPFKAPSTKIVSRYGPTPFNPAVTKDGTDAWDIRAAIKSINNATSPESNMYGELWSSSLLNSMHESEELKEFLDKVTLLTGDAGTDWWDSMMGMVLKLIHTREDRRVNRDVFFVELPGWDHHSDTKLNFEKMLNDLNGVLTKFVKELKKMLLWDQVTLVSVSDFGRTLVPNTGEGCDHAWGGHYWAMGGSVDGGQIHGQYPSDITAEGALNIGRGRSRIIPSLSWESIWNGVVEWLGVEGTEKLDQCMPNRHKTGTRLFTKSDIFRPEAPTVAPLPTFAPTTTPETPQLPPSTAPISPVQSPTYTPTSSPTSAPPTVLPTSSPTKSPTSMPTTASPTSAPIAATSLPTNAPTEPPIPSPPTSSPTPPTSVSLTNVALGKNTAQSSTPLAPMGSSNLAVDGNTNGLWWGGSVTHGSGHDWWTVDLGSMYSIHSVKIYNRLDCCKERLNSINIVIFDDVYTVLKVQAVYSSSANIVEWTFDVPITGRHVQIQNGSILNMAEVEVYGVLDAPPPPPTPALTNLALGKNTAQSSTPLAPMGSSNLAVDGNTNGLWWGGSVTHGSGHDWWTVDLGSMYSIHSVKIYNRLDCCKERLNSINIVIFDEVYTVLKVQAVSSSSANIVEWTFDVPITGRHVQIQNGSILNMAEVEVYGF